MKKKFDGAKNYESSIEVPDHILDMIPVRTENYIRKNFDRALGAANGMPEDQFRQASTHNIVNTPERRQLHREILQEVAARGLKGEKPDKPAFIYFVGPMAVGKTTLRNDFNERIEQENSDMVIAPYHDAALEDVYQKYKQAASYLINSDFNLYKENLPEFERFGNNFGVIRAEASALDQAVTAWAKELNASLILEQLGDGVDIEWAQEKAQEFDWITVGVTADPVTNACGLRERCNDTDQEISDKELAATIKGFSGLNAFHVTAQHANQAVLLQADHGYKAICNWKNGVENIQDDTAYSKFQSYANMSEEAIVSLIKLDEMTEPTADHDSIIPN